MEKTLRFISISHKTASTIQREPYHLSEKEQEQLTQRLKSTFLDMTGLFLLATCNRTELYFESTKTTANTILDFFIDYQSFENTTTEKALFVLSNETTQTVKHLLEVSSGLESMVFGDAEIISQIKKAHKFSMAQNMQGSLLERALQSVFKTHKRISNETDFRDGTTSVAYKSLKVIRDSFEKTTVRSKKILFVGAGDIVKQLFKYNSKFNFNNIYISNRSEDKALTLSQANGCKTYPWQKVTNNNFGDFDVIISAASNCPDLIKKTQQSNKKTLLIDLAVPCNIAKKLAENPSVIFHDLDSISVELEETKEHRLAAVDEVTNIIDEELQGYAEWLEGAPLRALLAEFKITINNKVKSQLETNSDNPQIKLITNQVMKKLMAEHQIPAPAHILDTLISHEISTLSL